MLQTARSGPEWRFSQRLREFQFAACSAERQAAQPGGTFVRTPFEPYRHVPGVISTYLEIDGKSGAIGHRLQSLSGLLNSRRPPTHADRLERSIRDKHQTVYLDVHSGRSEPIKSRRTYENGF